MFAVVKPAIIAPQELFSLAERPDTGHRRDWRGMRLDRQTSLAAFVKHVLKIPDDVVTKSLVSCMELASMLANNEVKRLGS